MFRWASFALSSVLIAAVSTNSGPPMVLVYPVAPSGSSALYITRSGPSTSSAWASMRWLKMPPAVTLRLAVM